MHGQTLMKAGLLVLLLTALLGAALYLTIRKLRRGGGCCGEHAAAEKRVQPADRNKAHYPFRAELEISGMTCQNCAVRVGNALNSLEGVWAHVDLSSKTAKLLLKAEPDERQLCQAVARAGYAAAMKHKT